VVEDREHLIQQIIFLELVNQESLIGGGGGDYEGGYGGLPGGCGDNGKPGGTSGGNGGVGSGGGGGSLTFPGGDGGTGIIILKFA